MQEFYSALVLLTQAACYSHQWASCNWGSPL